MRDFRVVGVGVVNWVILAVAHIRRERFAVVSLLSIVGLAIGFDELTNLGIWACSIVRGI